MLSENIFRITLCVSLIAHGVVFLKAPFFREIKFLPQKKIEVSYCFASKEKEISIYKEKDSLNNIRPNKDKLISRNIPSEKINFTPPKLPTLQAVNLTNIQSEYRRNPTELNKYYFEVWEKIRHCAYQQLYFERNLSGEIRLVFLVAKSGQLLNLDIVNDQALNMPANVKKAGSASIKNASPFPSFPKDLNKNQEIFDIIISFEPK